MNAKEAADRIRPEFHLVSMPPEDRHHVKFVEDVATELGVDHTSFNLHQVADALDNAGIHEDGAEYPKMLFSREHHTEEGISASVYDPRHDLTWALVDNEEQADKLGSGWVDNISDLPTRSDTAQRVEPAPIPEPVQGQPSETEGESGEAKSETETGE
jgi:hypothetical protein